MSRAALISMLLLIVGISEPIGHLLSIPVLQALGRFSSASNSPLVFNQVGGIEFWANRYRIELRGDDGDSVSIPVTNDIVARIRGPHARTAAYVVPIGLSPILRPDLYLPPLQFGLCGTGPLASDLGYAGYVVGASIEIESGSPHDSRWWMVEIPCGS